MTSTTTALSKHDSWIYLLSDSPFRDIFSFFPNGFPVRDPFPMAGAKGNTRLSLWVVDIPRLNNSQYLALGMTIARHLNIDVDLVLTRGKKEGFGIQHCFVDRLEGGAECYSRMIELCDFMEKFPHAGADRWRDFHEQQHQDWIEGNKDPLALPKTPKEVDPRLKPEDIKVYYEQKNFKLLQNFIGN